MSRTVLVGFLSGADIQVAVGEISGMLGLPSGGGHDTIHRVLADLQQIEQTNYTALAMSAAVLVIVVASPKISKRIPGPLIAVIGAIIASWALNLESYRIQILGNVPSGLPRISSFWMAGWTIIRFTWSFN